jgi:hypothetical protein
MSLEERSKTQIRRKLRNPPKPKRRLRVYALDPSIGKRLASIAVNETVLQVEWEEGLRPGPVGEYLEVVDVDPATNKVYQPVDLNEPKLLAQDGWHPSEGSRLAEFSNFDYRLRRGSSGWYPKWYRGMGQELQRNQ